MSDKYKGRGRPPKILKPSPDMCSFGIWLTSYMSKWKISQADVCSQLGISYSVLRSWIYGDHNPRVVNLIEVCDMLSRYEEDQPLHLLSQAIMTFDAAVYAQRRWLKRNPHKRRPQVIDEGLRFVPVDKALQSDIKAGDLVPTDDDDTQGCVSDSDTPCDLVTAIRN